jgi:DNA-directed RNA polymerase subunit E"
MPKGKKVCKKCKILIEGDKCPICNETQFIESWKGKIVVLDAEKSEIGKKMNIKQKGTYAIKT